jgi:hypothetical protein
MPVLIDLGVARFFGPVVTRRQAATNDSLFVRRPSSAEDAFEEQPTTGWFSWMPDTQ